MLFIYLGLAGLALLLSFVYAYLRSKFGGKALWFKMFVSALVLAVAVLAVLDPYNRSVTQIIMAVAIGLCFLGDLAIGVKEQRLVLGIGVFALAHIAINIALTIQLDNSGNKALAIFLPVMFGLIAVVSTLIFVFRVSLGGKTYAAMTYLVCISCTVALSFATLPLGLDYGFLLPLGAGLFFVSDLIIGYTSLKKDSKLLGFISSPAYFAAISCLALSISLCV